MPNRSPGAVSHRAWRARRLWMQKPELVPATVFREPEALADLPVFPVICLCLFHALTDFGRVPQAPRL